VSDIFREVEEDVRRERVEKLWKAYGKYVIALGVLLFAGLGAWQVWQRHEDARRRQFSAAFTAAQRITNPRAAAAAFGDMAGDAPAGYARLARLAEASAMFASGQQKNAVDLYKQIAESDRGAVGSVARLRAAWAQADVLTRPELAAWLAPLNSAGNPWRENAQEVLAYADYHALDMKSAQAKYSALANDAEAPDNLRARAKAMAAFLKNGGAVTYGSVPPDVVATPPAPAAPAPQANAAAAPAK
jgi:hypothetical protein